MRSLRYGSRAPNRRVGLAFGDEPEGPYEAVFIAAPGRDEGSTSSARSSHTSRTVYFPMFECAASSMYALASSARISRRCISRCAAPAAFVPIEEGLTFGEATLYSGGERDAGGETRHQLLGGRCHRHASRSPRRAQRIALIRT